MPRPHGSPPTTSGSKRTTRSLTRRARTDGTIADQHQRLVKAKRMICKRIRENHLFTFLEPPKGCATPIPATNNLIESWNGRIRDMLRHHRGLSLFRRIKAICWWCYQHTQQPKPASWLITNVISDQQIEEL